MTDLASDYADFGAADDPTLGEYLTKHGDTIDVRRFKVVGTRAWAARKRHCPCRFRISGDIDCLIWFRAVHEGTYVRRVAKLLKERVEIPSTTVCQALVTYDKPYTDIQWLSQRWVRYTYNETRVRKRDDRFVIGFHNVEFWEHNTLSRRPLYVKQPRWFSELDVPKGMYCLSPPVLAYFGSRTIGRGNACASVVWAIARNEMIVNAAEAFFQAVLHGMWPTSRGSEPGFLPDPELPVGRLFRLRPSLIRPIREFGVENVVEGSEYSAETFDAFLMVVEDRDWRGSEQWVVIEPETFEVTERRGNAVQQHAVGIYDVNVTQDDGRTVELYQRKPTWDGPTRATAIVTPPVPVSAVRDQFSDPYAPPA